jgi:molecular chaperone IbpA
MGINTRADAELTGRQNVLACKKEKTMTGVHSLFPRSSFVGFDHLFNELDYVTKHAQDNYPPHNVLKTGDTDYLIELAVAGFSRDELSIEVKDRTLTVCGEHVSKGREYIHRGISTKKFKRTFRLSEHVKVNGADLKDGVLSVELKYEIPQELRPRKIEIGHYEELTNDTTHSDTKQLLTESD